VKFSSLGRELILGLLQKDPEKRIGFDEIRRHKWLIGISWEKLAVRNVIILFQNHFF